MSEPKAIVRWSGELAKCRNDPSWQRLWLEVRSAEWRSVAIIPAEQGMSSIDVVYGLVSIGNQLVDAPVVVADLRQLPLRLLERAKAEVQRRMDDGETVVIALSSIDENPGSLHLARSADAIVVAVKLHSTPTRKIRDLLQKVGKKRVLGAVSLKEMNGNDSKIGATRQAK